jgi:hypothetical protein
MKMAVFWFVAPCSLVEVYQRPEMLAASIIIVLMMEAASNSEMLVNFNKTTRHYYNPEDRHLLIQGCMRNS